MKSKIQKIDFSYNKQIDKICWKRYDKFIKNNKSVWGIIPNKTDYVDVRKINLSVNVSEIINKYEKIFDINIKKIEGFIITTPYSMINDNERFYNNKGKIFLSIYNLFKYSLSVTLGHELFHIYFEKYTKRQIPNYDVSKEYFTIIMNDIFNNEISKGYPQHQEIRQSIFKMWRETKSIDQCIKLLYLSCYHSKNQKN